MIRVAVSDLPKSSRTSMGNITVRLDEGDLVADCSIVRAGDTSGEKGAAEPASDTTGSLPFGD